MKTLKLGLCFIDENDKVIAKKEISHGWQFNYKNMKNMDETKLDNEISKTLIDHLKWNLNDDSLVSMINEIKAKGEN